jgi:hypothetical protein
MPGFTTLTRVRRPSASLTNGLWALPRFCFCLAMALDIARDNCQEFASSQSLPKTGFRVFHDAP